MGAGLEGATTLPACSLLQTFFAAAAEGCNVKVPLLEMEMGQITCDAGGTEDDLPMLPAEAPPEAAPSAKRPPAMPRLVRTLLDGGHTDD